MIRHAKGVASYLPFVSILVVFAGFFYPSDPDLGYHLTIGSLVVTKLSFPTTDTFRVMSEQPEVAYSWLPAVSLYVAEAFGSVLGLRLWVILSLLVLTSLSTLIVFERLSVRQAAVVLFLASICFLQLATPRPRLWATIFLACLFLVLRTNHERERGLLRSLVPLSIVTILWANTHISVFLVLPIAGAYSFFAKLEHGAARALRGALAITAVLALAICFNPFGYRLYSLLPAFLPKGQEQVAPYIVELSGFLTMSSEPPVWWWPAILFMLFWVVLGVRTLRSIIRGPRPLGKRLLLRGLLVAISAGFLVLTIGSSRHLSLLIVSLLALLGEKERQKVALHQGSMLLGATVLVIAIFGGLLQADWGSTWYDNRFTSLRYPEQALASSGSYLVQAEPSEAHGRHAILTHFGKGHFTTWWLHQNGLASKAGVVLDGRSDSLGVHRFFLVQEAYRGQCMSELFERFGVSVVLVHVSDKLFDLLHADARWVAVGGGEIVSFVDVSRL